MHESSAPPRKDELRPDRATAGAVRPAGPGSSSAAVLPGQGEGITLVIRLEPNGPPTSIRVRFHAPFKEVKSDVLRRLGLTPLAMDAFVLARNGEVLDERQTPADLHLVELDFLSVGRYEDVYIADRDWNPRPPMSARGSGK